jgi:hypothetical protein
MMTDLKNKAESLFDKDVMVCIRTNSPSFIKYGKQMRGRLKSLYKEAQNTLKVFYNSLEREIPVEDIDYIVEDSFK